MKDSIETFEAYAIDVILGNRRGFRASFLRLVLRMLSGVWRCAVDLRLWLYRNRLIRERNLGCLVVSIGNLTVGGTGKTPVVEKFARALQEGGRNVAILSRGYRSVKPPLGERLKARLKGGRITDPPRVVSDGKTVYLDSKTAGDEPYMLASNLKEVAVVVDKDRVKAGKHAIKHLNADTLLLDDGLQYIRLKHRLDIVLVDRQDPFGNEYLLPRGTLREPPKNIRRASYIFITKCNGTANDELIERIRKHNRTAEIIECTHQPKYLQNAFTGERKDLDFLEGKKVGALSAIAQPASFEGALTKLGAEVISKKRFIDHHRYTGPELEQFINRCVERDLDIIMTTEKDSVKFPELKTVDLPIYYLRVEIEIINGHETWSQCVNRICRPRPMTPARLFF